MFSYKILLSVRLLMGQSGFGLHKKSEEFILTEAIDMLYHSEDASSKVFKNVLMLSEVLQIISAYTCSTYCLHFFYSNRL